MAGVIAQHLRAFGALAEDSHVVCSTTLGVSQLPVTLAPGDLTPSYRLCRQSTRDAPTYTQAHTPINVKRILVPLLL